MSLTLIAVGLVSVAPYKFGRFCAWAPFVRPFFRLAAAPLRRLAVVCAHWRHLCDLACEMKKRDRGSLASTRGLWQGVGYLVGGQRPYGHSENEQMQKNNSIVSHASVRC